MTQDLAIKRDDIETLLTLVRFALEDGAPVTVKIPGIVDYRYRLAAE